MNGTFIKLYRNILNWGWYTDSKTLHVFIHLLVRASISDREWKGIPLKRGEVPASFEGIAKETGLSTQNVRTAINHLKSTGEITSYSTSKTSVFCIVNYDIYQGSDSNGNKPTNTQFNNQLTSDQQATNKQLTTIKEIKNIKNDKKEDIGAVARFIKPSLEEVKAYCKDRKVDPDRFYDFYESKNWYVGKNKMKDWQSAVRNWERTEKEKPKETTYRNPNAYSNEKSWGKQPQTDYSRLVYDPFADD